jgi:hypothetical protein
MGGRVIEHQVNVEVSRYGRLDLIKEGSELGSPVMSFAGADDRACPYVKSGKQVGGAVALVVVAVPLDLPRSHE